MNEYYLKAPDEQTMVEVLKAAGFKTSDGQLQYESRQHCLILRGTLYKPTGKMLTDDEGFEYPEMQAVDGYHADLYAGSLPAELGPSRTDPRTPQFRRAK